MPSCISYVNLALFQNPDYMQEKFIIKIESLHLPDCGTTENVRRCSLNIQCIFAYTVQSAATLLFSCCIIPVAENPHIGYQLKFKDVS